jgi:hypothetical protein
MTNLGIAQALLFEPRKAFAEIAERPRYWFPLLALTLATVLMTTWYMSVVDLGWMMDDQLRHSVLARNLTEEQIAQQVQAAAGQRGLRVGASAIALPIVLPLVLMIPALYNFLVGKMVGFERSFRQWYSYTCWCALPGALAAIPAAIMLATTETTQIRQEALKTLSLNALFFHRAAGEPGYSVFSNFDLFALATLILSLIGVKVWSGRSWLFTGLFVGIPWALIYGSWAWFSLR